MCQIIIILYESCQKYELNWTLDFSGYPVMDKID